jgi:hypothetical protein
MKTLTVLALIIALTSCMPLTIPDTSIKTVTYELDKDTQKWTQQTCTGVSKYEPREFETVCYKQQIASPPPGAIKQ